MWDLKTLLLSLNLNAANVISSGENKKEHKSFVSNVSYIIMPEDR